jgi:protein TonB
MNAFNQIPAFDKAIHLDEVIFTGRNQAYGAFYLRKKYNKHMIIAFLITFALVGAISIPMLIIDQSPVAVLKVVVFNPLPPEKVDKNLFTPPPPPEKPEISEAMVKQSVFGPPIVVEKVKEYTEVDPRINLNSPVIPIQNATIEYIDTSSELEIFDINKPFVKVEVDATFKGGTLNDFRKWVAKKLVFPENASQMDISGKVIIQFVVNTKGKIEDIRIIKGVDPLLDQEAARVIASSPGWEPAKQQGVDVKQLFVIPITFQLKKN